LFDSKTLDISALQQDTEKHIKDEKVRTIILDALKERVVEESQPKSKPKLGARGRSESGRSESKQQ
jgi:hypothetical protein